MPLLTVLILRLPAMLVMNLTRPAPDAFAYVNSKVGNKYPVTDDQTMGVKLGGIYISNFFNALLDPDAFLSNYTLADEPAANYSNPFGLSLTNYSDISVICSGAGGADRANMSNIYVECGMIFGAARRIDGSQSLIFEPETWWTQSIYTCASTAKASIKETIFRHNITQEVGNTLKALTVVGVNEKNYTNKESMPLWGVETPPEFNLTDISQLWGLISPELEKSVNLSTLRAPQLYIPGGEGFFTTAAPAANSLPAASALMDILAGVYATTFASSGMPDFSGSANMAM